MLNIKLINKAVIPRPGELVAWIVDISTVDVLVAWINWAERKYINKLLVNINSQPISHSVNKLDF